MISPRLLLTNEHVFGSADEAEPSHRRIQLSARHCRKTRAVLSNFGFAPICFFSTMSFGFRPRRRRRQFSRSGRAA
jgi:hypothetical protein